MEIKDVEGLAKGRKAERGCAWALATQAVAEAGSGQA
jgi:hypothetical protein